MAQDISANDDDVDELLEDFLADSMNNSSEDNQLHPISCSYCRKNHRKCDRKKPSCTNCVKKGVVCNYSDPQKKGRKKKSTIEQQNNETVEQEENEDGNLEKTRKKSTTIHSGGSGSAQPYKVIQTDYSDIPLKRSTLDLFALLESPIQKTDFENYFNANQSGELKDDVIKALLFACQALIDQRMGDKESSKLSFNKARKIIQPHFDDIDNINVGCVYFLFCSFEASNANYRKVAFYFNILKTFVDDINRLENSNAKLTHTMKKLKLMSRFIEMTMSTSANIDCNNPLAIAKMFPKFVYAATGVESFVKLYEQLANLEKDRIEEYLVIIDSVCSFMNNHMKQLDENGERKNVIDLMSLLVSNGMKLASYLTVDNDNWEKIMTYSTNITSITENSLFTFIPSSSVSHVAMAAKQHLRLWSLIKLGMIPDFFQDTNTLQQLIYQDYRALSILSSRFDRVQKFYSDLLQELENFIKEYFTQPSIVSELSSPTIQTSIPVIPLPPTSTEGFSADDSFFFDDISQYEKDLDFQMSSGLGNDEQI